MPIQYLTCLLSLQPGCHFQLSVVSKADEKQVSSPSPAPTKQVSELQAILNLLIHTNISIILLGCARTHRTFPILKEYPVGFFAVVVSALEGKDCKESVRAIAESVDLSEEQLTSLISGMYTLLREALRLPLLTFKQEVFKEDLQELRIPEELIMDFASVVFGNRRPVVEATTTKQGNKLPSVNDIKWRVDVAISTSSLARALQPSILMLLKLSDGTAHRFEVPVVKFQELRYNVALILKEMNDLEKRSILKIQD
nr:COMM domain-containing protein 5 [Chrysemys picta bellii]